MLAPFYGAFTPETAWRIGTEAEKFGVLDDTLAPIPYAGDRSVSAVLRALQEQFGWFAEREHDAGEVIALRRVGASITLEPGGQLELSGTPLTDVCALQAEFDLHAQELRTVGAQLGISWLGLGFHPFARQADLPWVPKLRYGVMREYLPTRGSMGLDMMRRTATIQTNLDYASEADAMQKLQLGLKVSPIIAGMFANSPLVEGKLTGETSHRAEVWLHTDPDRTGLLPAMWAGDASFERYVQWALDVPMFIIKRGDKALHNTGQTFRAFMRDGFEGARATMDDWLSHLGTLFPEVRLKKTIELRSADSPPPELTAALPALCKGIFYDARARGEAMALTESITHEAAQQARRVLNAQGLRTPLGEREIGGWATALLDIAVAGLERLGSTTECGRQAKEVAPLKPLIALVESGVTPAQRLIGKLDQARDLPAQVMALARF